EATLAACQLRLRPILMTSFAFILGVVPLLLGRGAGAEMRRVLGVAVFSGMVGVTLFGIFLTPVFFYVIEGVVEAHPFAWLSAGGAALVRPLRLPGRKPPARPPAAVAVNGVSPNGNGAARRAPDRVTSGQ